MIVSYFGHQTEFWNEVPFQKASLQESLPLNDATRTSLSSKIIASTTHQFYDIENDKSIHFLI